MISLILLGAIGLAGALGAVARYLFGRFMAERIPSPFPLGTFIINISGAFLIGLLFALTTKKVLASTTQSILATGFMGGFTTFSTLNWETVQLGRSGNTTLSSLYLGGTYVLGLCAVILGIMLGQVL
ncbi:MAG: fluoride efflux transporter CrcB [Ktedonobacteraceae bacterium]|nr:fluoride efflux transporter CrcB [Ktedonobacteraceae bacterium]